MVPFFTISYDSESESQKIILRNRENMSKSSQKIVLFIEPNDDEFWTPSKIGHLFMNRFAIDENAGSEVVKVLELEKAWWEMSDPEDPEYYNFVNERTQKGIDLIDNEK